MAVVSAVFFGALGLRYGDLHDDEVGWLSSPVAGVLGAVLGALIGYGISSECREPRPTGLRRVVVVAGIVSCVAVVIGMRYLRYTN
jgi:uncharacterized membrane protein YeaQ/YmgE (transglycosylase-associated protein family)